MDGICEQMLTEWTTFSLDGLTIFFTGSGLPA
jgi:hypothetical protein